jgi:hypothetical protein
VRFPGQVDARLPERKRKMDPLQEKRSTTRNSCEGRITLQHTHSQSQQFAADLINYSAQGISFFSNRPLMPGTTIIIRTSVENYRHMSENVDCQLRSMGLATIKWCHEGTRQGRPVHEMGAAYMLSY